MTDRIPSSFTTVSAWRTTKRSYGPLMKLNARWSLPDSPFFKEEKSNGSDKNQSNKKDQQDSNNCHKSCLRAIKNSKTKRKNRKNQFEKIKKNYENS